MKRLGLLLSVLTFAIVASFFTVSLTLADTGPLPQNEGGEQVKLPPTEEARFTRATTPATAPQGQGALPTRGSTTITHSASQTITTGNSVACTDNTTGFHTPNSYYRVFDLAGDFGITEAFDITEVQFGIEQATAGSAGSQSVEVRLHTLVGVLNTANLTLIGSTTVSVPNQTLTIFSAPIAVTVPAGSVLVVEIFTPDGRPLSNAFFIGSNAGGQTDPSYLRATDCGVAQPTDTAAIGFPGMQIVVNVVGDVAGGQPSITLDKTVGTDSSACAITDVITVTAGDTAYYCYTVTNTGGITLGTHDLNDSELGMILDDFPYDLAPGASTFLTVSAPITVTTSNVGTWTASSATGASATATDTATVNVVAPTAIQMADLGTAGSNGFPLPLLAAGAGFLALAGLVLRRSRR